MFGKLFSKKLKQRETPNDGVISNGVDPEMNYCPACGDEYRTDIQKCAGCEIELVSGLEKLAEIQKRELALASRSMEISVDDELITLRKGQLKDVKQLKKLLAKERIPAILAGDEQSCGKGCCGQEMYLQTRVRDAESAMAVLNQEFVKNTSLASHDMTYAGAVFVEGAESVVCPACGCNFAPDAEMDCPECGLSFS